MKIVGFIGYIWMPKWHRYSACSYQDAFICPATGRALPPSRDCFLDEDLIFFLRLFLRTSSGLFIVITI